MSTEEKIKKYIEECDLYKKALLIDDKWGTGKTYMVKNVLAGKINDFQINNAIAYSIINANEIDLNTSFRRLLLSSSNNINTNDFHMLGDKASNKYLKFITENKKTVGQFLEKATGLVDGYIENKTGMQNTIGNSLDFLGISGELALKKIDFTGYILVIDEIDRITSEFNLKNIYSKIIELQENTNVRVIVIMNSEKLSPEDNVIHNNWKEKLYSAIIKIEGNDYFNNIKPKFWDDVEPKILRFTKNYKNIRIIEKYNEFDISINRITSTLLNDIEINQYQESHIKNFKENLIENMFAYYNQEDYQTYIGEKYNTLKIDEKYEIIQMMLNLDDSLLKEKLKNIITYYNSDYARLQNAVTYFYDNFIHNDQIIEKKNKKDEAFIHVRDELINKNLENIELTSIDYYHNHDKEKTLLFYLNYLKESFKITKNEENQIISLIFKKLKKDKKYHNFSNIELIKELRKQETIYKNIIYETCVNQSVIRKILKSIKNNIKKIVLLLLNSYTDNMPSDVKRFHFIHNTNIIEDIYNGLDDKGELLLRLRELKNFLNMKEYETLIKKYYSSLKPTKITKDEMIKV